MVKYGDLKKGSKFFMVTNFKVQVVTISDVENGKYCYICDGEETYCTKYIGKYTNEDILYDLFKTKAQVKKALLDRVNKTMAKL